MTHMSITRGFLLGGALLGALTAIEPARGQFAVLEFRAIGASGVECVNGASDHPSQCDWFVTADHVLVLHRVPQEIKWDLFISEFGDVGNESPQTRVRAYQARIACSSLFNGQGRLVPIDTRCTDFPIPDSTFCTGVDETHPAFIFGEIDVLQACNLLNDCPDGLPGAFFCGALAIASDDAAEDPGPGNVWYGATYAALVPTEARGLFRIGVDATETQTFLLDVQGDPVLPLSLREALVRIRVGRCCGVPSARLACQDGVTYETCLSLGGSGFLPDETCSGLDQDQDLVDDACVACRTDDDCPDAPPCAVGVCDDGESLCRLSLVEGNVCLVDGECLPDSSSGESLDCMVCDPDIDERALVPVRDGRLCASDGNPCTDDECLYGVCENQPVTGRACGNPADSDCDGADQCVAGICDPMIAVVGTHCGIPTNTFCNPADTCDGAGLCQIHIQPDRTTCEDGRFCTIGDACQNGICFPGNDDGPCVNDFYCDELNDRCVDCLTDLDCTDGNECTENRCTDGACVTTQREFGTACGDQSTGPCDGADICDGNGQCISNHVLDGTDCEDGFFCNGIATCQSGICEADEIPCMLPHRVCDEIDDVCICVIPDGEAPDPGDFDVNGTVNLADFASFPECILGGAYAPSSCCVIFDANDDGRVDLWDAAGFQIEFESNESEGG